MKENIYLSGLRERYRQDCAEKGIAPGEDIDRLETAAPADKAYFDELRKLYGLPVNRDRSSSKPAP